mgnify:CR=1 FL=1
MATKNTTDQSSQPDSTTEAITASEPSADAVGDQPTETASPPATGGKDDLIVEGLAMGLNQRQTSEFAGVHPKTVQRKMADEAFAVLVAQRRAERVRELAGQLVSIAADAIVVIQDAMAPEQPIRVRLAAAQLAMRNVTDFQASTEMDARIADLERLVARMHAFDDQEAHQ